MTPAEIDAIYNKLDDIGRGDLADQFLKNPDAFDFSVLEDDPNFTDKYANVAEFVGNKYKILSDLYTQFDGKKPTASRFESLQAKYPFLDRKELDDWFDKSNKYKEEYIAQRKKDAGIKRREMEVKNDWGIAKHLLASDYEKQRYIHEPENAIFGKEAAGFIGSSAGAKADLITGAAAAAADVVPKPSFIAVGPALRASRDVAHKVTNSPYQKEWSQIGRDAATDLTAGGAAMALANARKVARIAEGLFPQEVRTAFNVAEDTRAVKQGLNALGDIDKMSNTELWNYIKALPDSPLKQDLVAATADAATKGIDRDAIGAIITNYQMATVPGLAGAAHSYVNIGKAVPFDNKLLKEAAMVDPLNKSNKIKLALLHVASALNTGKPGYMVYNTTRKFATPGAEPQKQQTVIEKQLKKEQRKWFIDNYKREWEAGFVPHKIEGDPLWEAYKEWKEGK